MSSPVKIKKQLSSKTTPETRAHWIISEHSLLKDAHWTSADNSLIHKLNLFHLFFISSQFFFFLSQFGHCQFLPTSKFSFILYDSYQLGEGEDWHMLPPRHVQLCLQIFSECSSCNMLWVLRNAKCICLMLQIFLPVFVFRFELKHAWSRWEVWFFASRPFKENAPGGK